MAVVILPKSSASAFFLTLKHVPVKSEEELMSLQGKVVNYIKDEAINEVLSRYIKFERAVVNKYSYSPEDVVLVVGVKDESRKPSSFYDLTIVRFLGNAKITVYVR